VFFDPQADKEEVMHEYGLHISKDLAELKEQRFEAVIHAVAHKEFMQTDLSSLMIRDGVLYDVKSVLPKKHCGRKTINQTSL